MISTAPTRPLVAAVLALAMSPQLAPRQPVPRELSGGDSHEYRVTLAAGEYVRVTILQETINVAVTVVSPDGDLIGEIDATGIGDTEAISVVAGAPGAYLIRVHASESTAPAGRYRIELDEVRPATARDAEAVAGERAFSAAMAQWGRDPSAAGARRSIDQLGEAAAHWHAADDRAREAMALYTTAHLYRNIADKSNALSSGTRGLAVARESGDRHIEAWALNFLGQIYADFSDPTTALRYYTEALALTRQTGDRTVEAASLNNLGTTSAALGDKPAAIKYFEQALPIYHDSHDRRREATILGNLGVTSSDAGDMPRAIDAHTAALALQRALGNPIGEALALNNLGAVHSNQADYQDALDAYTASLRINQRLGRQWDEAVNLNNIAWVHAALGDRATALDLYSQSLAVLRRIDDPGRAAIALNNIGAIYNDLGDYRRALAIHLEALPLRRAVKDPTGEAITLNNIGYAYFKLGDRTKAGEYYQQAASLHRTGGDRRQLASSLRNLGMLSRASGDAAKARACLDEALAIGRDINDRNGEGSALAELARVDLDDGRLDDARAHAADALAAFESLRVRVTSPQLRASFFASVRQAHETYVAILMRLHRARPSDGFDAAAFLAAEKGRARSLLELIAESHAAIREGADPELLARERTLRATIADRAEQQVRALAVRRSAGPPAPEATTLEALTAEYDDVQNRIRQTSPRYAALTMPVPLTVAEIQREVLDDDTTIVEFALGAESSHVFAVTRTSLVSADLPPRARLEADARAVYSLLTARGRAIANESAAARLARVERADARYPAAAAALSRRLLGPVAASLRGKRLVIVAEGALQYLPFAALPDPGVASGIGPPLVARHEVTTAPSASVLALLHAPRAVTPDRDVALFADPVFDPDDSRVAGRRPRAGTAAKPPVDLLRAAKDSGLQRFARLRFSRSEANEIARLAPRTRTFTALDFAANRTAALSAELGRYRILHFATHGLIDNRRPDLSGLVLSLVDDRGRPVNGFVRVYDVYNMRLGADLVVLSACQTALGPDVAGEGLIGLTRGFMYAGTPRIVASLWQVDDRTTSAFMRRFYEPMLARGERPAAALRAAQLAIRKTEGRQAPFFWAAFALQGRWD